MTKRATRSSMTDMSENIKDEVRKVLDINGELVDILTLRIKDILIDELTNVIADKVAQSMKESMEFDLAERDEKISVLQKELHECRCQQDEMEQYSRRNCLIFHGVNEREGEITDVIVKDLCKDRLDIDISAKDLDRSHRLGQSKGKNRTKPRGIIAKFTNYNVRNRVYQGRRNLRDQQGPPIFIQENLTKLRTDLFWEIKSKLKNDIKHVWTQDGRIKVVTSDDRRVTLTNRDHLKRIKLSS